MRLLTLSAVLFFHLSTLVLAQSAPQQDDTALLSPLLECYEASKALEQSGAIANLRDCLGTAAEACLNSDQNQSSQNMADCIQPELLWWDNLLNTHLNTLRTRLKPAQQEQLQQVQRQWVRYRDSKCQFDYDFFEGGPMQVPASAWCLMDTTAIRAIELEQWLNNVPG